MHPSSQWRTCKNAHKNTCTHCRQSSSLPQRRQSHTQMPLCTLSHEVAHLFRHSHTSPAGSLVPALCLQGGWWLKAISSAESLPLSVQAQLQRQITVSNRYCCGRILAGTQRIVWINPQLIPNPISCFLFPGILVAQSDSILRFSFTQVMVIFLMISTNSRILFLVRPPLLISFVETTLLWRSKTEPGPLQHSLQTNTHTLTHTYTYSHIGYWRPTFLCRPWSWSNGQLNLYSHGFPLRLTWKTNNQTLAHAYLFTHTYALARH